MNAYPSIPACYAWPVPTPLADDSYIALVRWHDGRCGMCGEVETARKNRGTAPRGLSEDHDHETGRTRGFLCRRCNLHEGRCGDLACGCVAWRARPAVDVLGVTVEHRGYDTSVDAQFRRCGIDPEQGRKDAMRRFADTMGSLLCGDPADDAPPSGLSGVCDRGHR